MPIDRDLLRTVQQLMRPLATRIANTVARAVVQLASDGTKQQLVQLGVLAGETIDGAEHMQPYGFTSVPLPGAEAVVLFPNGARDHALVLAASDRRYRPTGGQPGQVGVYHYRGAKITMLENGDVEIQPGTGGMIYIRDAGGTAEPLVRRSEFNAHSHTVSTTGSSSAQTGTAAPPTAVTGTAKLRVQ